VVYRHPGLAAGLVELVHAGGVEAVHHVQPAVVHERHPVLLLDPLLASVQGRVDVCLQPDGPARWELLLPHAARRGRPRQLDQVLLEHHRAAAPVAAAGVRRRQLWLGAKDRKQAYAGEGEELWVLNSRRVCTLSPVGPQALPPLGREREPVETLDRLVESDAPRDADEGDVGPPPLCGDDGSCSPRLLTQLLP
jgi:hypothetical protein